MKEKLYYNIDLRMEAVEESIKYLFESLGTLLGELHHIQYLNFLAREIDEKSKSPQSNKHTEQ